ncbi:MAG: ABC transporter permease subunit [Pseudomonadota bacterium]
MTTLVKSERMRKWRNFKDGMARYLVTIGGMSTIVAILLIFFYLFYVVFPLFAGAEITRVASFASPGAAEDETVYLAMEEQAEIGVRFTGKGEAVFFRLKDGAIIDRKALPIPEGIAISAFSKGEKTRALVAYGLADGRAVVARHTYQLSYPENKRVITPGLEFPFGEAPVVVDPAGAAITQLAVQQGEEGSTLVAATADGRLVMTYYTTERSFLDDEVTVSQASAVIAENMPPISRLLLDYEQRKLYAVDSAGELIYYDISNKDDPVLIQRLHVVEAGRTLASLEFLIGHASLLVGDSAGTVAQWFAVRDENNNMMLTKIREFSLRESPVAALSTEYGRKGFLAVDGKGNVGIFHATSERTLLVERVSKKPLLQVAVAPRADAMLIADADGMIHFWEVKNKHPEVSWKALWGKVWYEHYEKPDYIWQSSSSSNDFEPKYSLVPISFGTIKAAFYAMLFAMPLAILGAIYTAYFMSARMRRIVKPSVEIMEALPTVILGFLAGLWLAPFLEKNLPGVVSLLILLPIGIIVVAFLWQYAPRRLRHAVPEGWEAALLLPVVVLLGWAALASSTHVEAALFQGDIRSWLTNEMGIDFDQRNSLVVGLAMGFAVVPMVFSIAEDAIFGVPRHLSHGSLALGATPWQTMVRVVLLTASPGIFSAIMIGVGRAVGETMIVLMATGNTPVMDFSIFQGLRTLSANIAVEMPESEVNSTHYRILFLAALVLLIFTFFFNTIAELVRQRLRKKYSSL